MNFEDNAIKFIFKWRRDVKCVKINIVFYAFDYKNVEGNNIAEENYL